MRILFLTTQNLATNPRIVKEIKLALQHNYQVEVICYIFRNWSYKINNEMLEEFGNQDVKFHCIEAGRKDFISWLFSVLKEKSARLISRIIIPRNPALANAVSRRNVGLLAEVNKIRSANWVIGHNPGALWATYYAGKKLNCKMGFDVEDYHPGEGNDRHLQRLTKKLMQQVLPQMTYVSFAAPLIMEEVNTDIDCDKENWFTVLNYFPSEEFTLPETEPADRLKLVWFSQNITFGRGLELILPAVHSNSENLELHLYGNVNEQFKKRNLDGWDNIFLHGTISQSKLHKVLSKFDIGLALDVPNDKNRELALTNKLLVYLQAGLYVLATNTQSHKNFMASFPEMGICFDFTKNKEDKIFASLLNKIDTIRSERNERFEKFKNKNWEIESVKILNKINSL